MFSFVVSSALAGDREPLFVNTTTDDARRAETALTFSKNQLDRQHPVTIFLSDRAVHIATKGNAALFKEHHALLNKLIEEGASVLVCGVCLERYGVAEKDLLPGIKVSTPELLDAALFKEGTKTLSW
jgi:sulfur relay (sulfurtransferase) complex TusBCD TusD component (DsrE family)